MDPYSRFGSDSDVFVYKDEKIGTLCYSCPFDDAEVDPRSRAFHTHDEVLAHLDDHLVAGHKVPRATIDRFKSEMGLEV